MMEAALAPVIISNAWVPPLGPDWGELALLVGEKENLEALEIEFSGVSTERRVE